MSKKILVVDDEKEVVSTLEAFFQSKGYSMLTALNGREAIEAVENEPLDLVLLDMKMPGIDGVDVLKKIREIWRPIRVIVITGYIDEYKDVIREIGGVDFVFTKPIALVELAKKIEEILAKTDEVIKKSVEKSKMVLEKIEEIFGQPQAIPSGEKIFAKILILESVYITYQILLEQFKRRKKFNEEYEVEWAHTENKFFSKLESFRPDIVLLNYTEIDKPDALALKILNSPFKPKEVIIYGIFVDDKKRKEIEKLGIRTLGFPFIDPKQINQMIEMVRDISLKYGLKE